MNKVELLKKRKKRLKTLINRFITTAFFFSVLLGGALLYNIKSVGYLQYRQVCRAIHKGDTLESIRATAGQWGYIFEPDPDPTGNSPDPIFVLRPTRQWPAHFSCKIAAVNGIVK